MTWDRSSSRLGLLFTVVALLLPLSVSAQTGTDTAAPEHKIGDYIVSQSVEFGYRFTDVKGAKTICPAGTEDRSSAGLCQDESMYNTFVNLHTGPRLLEQTLSLRSPGNHGVLFDNLFVSSFGFGGDPNNVARLRISKSRVYNLNANFRRDQNFFNYDLLTNPLNVVSGTITQTGNTILGFGGNGGANGFLVTSSPHAFSNIRRMSDVDLIIAPQSVISLRLGYSRVRNEGPVLSTFHMPHGTDILLTEPTNVTSDFYRAGIDFRFLPHTTISYDQFFAFVKNDNSWTDRFLVQPVAGVGLVDPGISFNLGASQPCPRTFYQGNYCNADQSFARLDRYRTTTPTEQLSFQSHAKKLDLSGRLMYTHSHMNGVFTQNWTGLAAFYPRAGGATTGAIQRQDQLASFLQNRRTEAAADFGVTFHLTEKLRLVDNFRWYNWRLPTLALISDTAWTVTAAAGAVNLTTPVSTITPTVASTGTARFWKEERKENEVSLEYDFTRAVGARVGYRFTDRFLIDTDETADLVSPEEGFPASGDIDVGEDRASLTGHSALFGLWVRPNEKFRASFDGELTSNHIETGGGNTGIDPNTTFGLGPLTRITPRHEQQYRVRANYNPQRWVVISGSLNFSNQRNRLLTDDYNFHNYNGGASIMINPNDKLTFDMSYNYSSYLQENFICPIGFGSGVPFGAPITSATCPGDTTGLYQTVGRFEGLNNFFSATARTRVLPHVTTDLGYSVSNNDGAELFTNALLVPGSIKNTFHRPLAAVEIGLAKGWAAKAGWNYYDYNEKGAAGPTLPRDFHANSATLSLRYAF